MDEIDYMSDNLLSNCSDVRPGLIHSQSVKRKHKIERKQLEANKKSFTKPLKKLEEERRLEGLNSALTSNNKGFELLQKMGYKPGMVIGKEGG
ncbi:G patch domain-containing protein 11-like [Centruroides sculpturatus]|uniref:G patch domain-containing protein 11-like n=1 Tax=Centruroides sculpturatus TaxID=218467 RepID=UPI000C6EEED5|nr:G patch domain-containing protein 11-like [Centruroides sculpturatus]